MRERLAEELDPSASPQIYFRARLVVLKQFQCCCIPIQEMSC